MESSLRCWYCGIDLLPKDQYEKSTPIPQNLHVRDHQIPKSWGKWDESALNEDNLVDACWACNAEKGAKDVAGFRLYQERKFEWGEAVQLLEEAYRKHYCNTKYRSFFIAMIRETRDRHPMPLFYGERIGNGKVPVV